MKLSVEQINSSLKNTPGWLFQDTTLIKEYRFKDFKEAIEFVNKLAPVAEELNHHPDISISYNKVFLRLSSHSEQGLTEKDFTLAQRINELF